MTVQGNTSYRVRRDEHFVHFYDNEDRLITEVGNFISSSLRTGETAIVIATEAHRNRIERRVRIGVPHFEASPFYREQYIALDARSTLTRFLIDDWPDAQCFADVVGGIVRRAAQAGCGRIAAFGEMVALLVEADKTDAALRLEELWNELTNQYSFSLLCAYPSRLFRDPAKSSAFAKICRAHSRVCTTN
jgi:hypothetical protein